MTQTNNLKITLLEQSQAQKEITINEGVSIIDAILNRGVIDKDLSTPPGSPSSGDLYIVGSSPTGSWAGQAKKIAWFNQVWNFISPNEGMHIWVNDENKIYVYDSSNWVILIPDLNAVGGVNISGTPADNSFFTYDNASSKWVDETPANARTSMGLGTIATQSAASVAITGGSINGAAIGASTAAAGTFTNLTGTVFTSAGIDDNATSIVVEVESNNNTLSFTGQVATTLKSKRHTTSDTAGNNLSVVAGGATASATNKNGGTLVLSGGASTGTGTSSVEIKTCSAGSSGTSDNTAATRVTVAGDTITFNGTVTGGNISVNAQTGTSYTVTASDNGKIITLNNSGATTITLPQTSTESLPKGFNIAVVQLGTGEVTIAKQGSDNLYTEGNKLKLNGQYAQVSIVKIVEGSPNTWVASGSLKV